MSSLNGSIPARAGEPSLALCAIESDGYGSIPARAGEPTRINSLAHVRATAVYPRTGGGTSTKQQTDNAQLLRNKCRVCVLTGS